MEISEIYNCLQRCGPMVEATRTTLVFGPEKPDDLDVLAESEAFITTPTYRSRRATHRQRMHFGETEPLTSEPSRSQQQCFEVGADILLLAYGGVLEPGEYDGLNDLHTWAMNEDFGKLIPPEVAVRAYASLVKDQRDRIPGVRHKEIDKHVTKAKNTYELCTVYNILAGQQSFDSLEGTYAPESGPSATLEKLIKAGIMVPQNYSDEGGRYHVRSKKFLALFPRDKNEDKDWNLRFEMKNVRQGTIRKLAERVESRDPVKDKDLIRIDRYVLEHLG